MDVNIEQLSAFIAVYEAGSFALAAHKEKKHASTLSRRVSNLEIELGYELFERHTSSLAPNQHATELYEYAKAVKFEVEQFNARALSVLQELPSTLTLAVDSSVLGMRISKAIAKVIKKYPTFDLVLIDGDTQQSIQRLYDGEADLAIVLSTEHYALDVGTVKLLPFEVVSVASPDYIKEFDLGDSNEVNSQTRRRMHQIILKSFCYMGYDHVEQESHHVYRVNSFPSALELIVNGIGWGYQPLLQCKHLLDSGDLVELDVDLEHNLRWSPDAIWSSSKPLSEPLKMLIDVLSKEAQLHIDLS
ncbi:LysR family transcriptional regulator [Vibrio europaeus]|uniref:LysR family transcriptional regulator n=1 Tax=Vibrio europaeus TaxID=300876 RepID=UPI002340E4B5|nr:LysR family transcriptional regulator [Vibrio europaeus]MDC5839429.1 LysR family transcriptional regulator [Vibrio europaeus]